MPSDRDGEASLAAETRTLAQNGAGACDHTYPARARYDSTSANLSKWKQLAIMDDLCGNDLSMSEAVDVKPVFDAVLHRVHSD